MSTDDDGACTALFDRLQGRRAMTISPASTTSSATSTLSPLSFVRSMRPALSGGASADRASDAQIGGPTAPEVNSGGLGARTVGALPDALTAPLLWPIDAVVDDAWVGAHRARTHRHGSVTYATDGTWLHGWAEIDERKIAEHGLAQRGIGSRGRGRGETALQSAARRAYADLFAVLAQNDCPNLLRLWNYLADINLETEGMERYRQFNAGRQQAFIDARRSAFDGSPAACALGVPSGPLRVYFLAGRQPPLAIENPRQVSAYRYPDAYGVRSPTFSRAALVDVGSGRTALFVSGTASIVGHETVHVGDVRLQTLESLANIAAVREAAERRASLGFDADRFVYTVYVRHAADLSVVRSVFEASIGVDSPAVDSAIYLQADICRADLLVEIEAHAIVRSSPTP